jgi:tRNA uridine 5-carboxymethylaminomethyl modification enzyme
MIDDLITRGVSEPYRMFTSRAEYRLSLRADNADQRLTQFGVDSGLVGEGRAATFRIKFDCLTEGKKRLDAVSFSSRELAETGATLNKDGIRRSGYDSLSIPGVGFENLLTLEPALGLIEPEIQEQLARDALYHQYLKRQTREIEAVKKDQGVKIPKELAFIGMQGLSGELAMKLDRVRPETLAQASRIEGMTPAALTLILAKTRQIGKRKRA